MLYVLGHDMVHGFIKDLAFPLCLVLTYLIIARSPFPWLIDYERAINKASIGIMKGW